MKTKEIVHNVFMLFISIILSLAVYIFSGFDNTMKNLQNSVDTLNINVAKTGEKIVSQNKEINIMRSRIERLEHKVYK